MRGNKYGRWLVLGDAPDRVYNKKNGGITRIPCCYCECECGAKKDVTLSNLRNGYSTQCKLCSDRKSALKRRKYDLKKSYGRWTVLFNFTLIPKKNTKFSTLFCECKCECGTIRFIPCTDLRNGYSSKCQSCTYKENGRKLAEFQIAKFCS